MKLYHKSELLQTALRAIDEKNADSIEATINAFNEPNFKGVDSLRFIITKRFFNKIKQELAKFELYFAETSFNSRHYTLADIFSDQTPKTAYTCKITAKINAYAYHSTDTLNLCRKANRRLNERLYFEIHGLFQYESKSDKPLSLDKHTKQILSFLFRYANFAKSRHNISLKSLDYALDYVEQGTISKDYAISKADFIEHLEADFKTYATTLYIQKSTKPNAPNISGVLQRIKLYDKKTKNALQMPITRAELCFFIDEND